MTRIACALLVALAVSTFAHASDNVSARRFTEDRSDEATRRKLPTAVREKLPPAVVDSIELNPEIQRSPAASGGWSAMADYGVYQGEIDCDALPSGYLKCAVERHSAGSTRKAVTQSVFAWGGLVRVAEGFFDPEGHFLAASARTVLSIPGGGGRAPFEFQFVLADDRVQDFGNADGLTSHPGQWTRYIACKPDDRAFTVPSALADAGPVRLLACAAADTDRKPDQSVQSVSWELLPARLRVYWLERSNIALPVVLFDPGSLWQPDRFSPMESLFPNGAPKRLSNFKLH